MPTAITDNERTSEQVRLLLDMAWSDYTEARTSATVQLVGLGKDALPGLIQFLSSRIGNWDKKPIAPVDEVVIASIGLIGDLKGEEVLGKALKALTEDSRANRQDGIKKGLLVALKRIGSTRQAEWLEWVAPNMAAKDLAEIVGKDGVHAIMALLNDADVSRQTAGVNLAIETRATGLGEPLGKLLKENVAELTDENAKVVKATLLLKALDLAGGQRTVEVVQWWTDEVTQQKSQRREYVPLREAFSVVGKHGGAAVVTWLVGHVARGRQEAGEALLEIGEKARPELLALASNPDTKVRKVALNALARIEEQVPARQPRPKW